MVVKKRNAINYAGGDAAAIQFVTDAKYIENVPPSLGLTATRNNISQGQT